MASSSAAADAASARARSTMASSSAADVGGTSGPADEPYSSKAAASWADGREETASWY